MGCSEWKRDLLNDNVHDGVTLLIICPYLCSAWPGAGSVALMVVVWLSLRGGVAFLMVVWDSW